jgi:glycerol uptake facilitator-like aquaporin
MTSIGDRMPYMGVDELKAKAVLIKCLFAEMLGTLFLVFIGCGSCVGSADSDRVNIALAFGLAVATMAQE